MINEKPMKKCAVIQAVSSRTMLPVTPGSDGSDQLQVRPSMNHLSNDQHTQDYVERKYQYV